VRIAQHERSYDRSRQILDLEHYLDVLERKTRALRGSKCGLSKAGASCFATAFRHLAHPPPRQEHPAAMCFFLAASSCSPPPKTSTCSLAAELMADQRITLHLWRMCFRLFFAIGSFFLGQQQVFPAFLRGSIFLAVLALLPFPVMIYWLIRVRFSYAYKIQPTPGPIAVAP
jgi:hypothetical protein